jgi:peptidoglycan-associated lipoprotein
LDPDPVPPNTGGVPSSEVDISKWNEDRSIWNAYTIYFDFDKSNVKPSEVSKLESLANSFKGMTGKAILVEGNCDERGTEEYNRSLGEKRAQSAREYLIRLGVSSDSIHTKSFGEEKPLDNGHNEAAWQKNRRDEFILLSPP